MIEITKTAKETGKAPRIRVVGVGNAGVNLIDRMMVSLPLGTDLWAVNTDAQSLTSSVADNKLLLGDRVTRGLGAGGDPDLGREAAEESRSELKELLVETDVLVVVAGLGGGTASSVAPILAADSAAAGVLTVCVVTSPFTFEGRRRATQADHAQDALARTTHGLLVFENDRMSEVAEPSGRLADTFAASDETLAAAVSGLLRLLNGTGPMNITRGDLVNTIPPGSGRYLFGCGFADGANRTHEALERALRSPLLPDKTNFGDATTLLVHFDAPGDFSFAELQAAMREISRMCDESTRVCFGVSTDGEGDGLGIVLLGLMARTARSRPSAASGARSADPAAAASEPPIEERGHRSASKPAPEPAGEALESPPSEPTEAEPQSELFNATQLPPTEKRGGKKTKPKQETLPFEPATRGRFEKSEPTIIEGEDLDVPTYLRMKIRLK